MPGNGRTERWVMEKVNRLNRKVKSTSYIHIEREEGRVHKRYLSRLWSVCKCPKLAWVIG